MEDIWVQLFDREGPLGHKRPACMLLLVFFREAFLFTAAPRTRKEFLLRQSLLWLRGRTIGALRAERHTLTSAEWTSCPACHELLCSLLARLPLYCSAECATPKNSSLFAFFSRNLANAPLPCLRNARAFPLLPAALASVPFGFVLVRVRVRSNPGGSPKRIRRWCSLQAPFIQHRFADSQLHVHIRNRECH